MAVTDLQPHRLNSLKSILHFLLHHAERLARLFFLMLDDDIWRFQKKMWSESVSGHARVGCTTCQIVFDGIVACMIMNTAGRQAIVMNDDFSSCFMFRLILLGLVSRCSSSIEVSLCDGDNENERSIWLIPSISSIVLSQEARLAGALYCQRVS